MHKNANCLILKLFSKPSCDFQNYSKNLITVLAVYFTDECIKTSQYKMVAKIPPIVSPTYIATNHTGGGSITVRANWIYLFPLLRMSGFHYFFLLQQKENE
jgi:hypothetical protein